MGCDKKNCSCCQDVKSEKSYEFLNALLVQNYNQRLQVLAFALIMSLALLSGFYSAFTDSFNADNNLAPVFVLFVSILITYVVKLLECRNKESKDAIEEVIKDVYPKMKKAISGESRYVKFASAIDIIFYILYCVQGVSLGLFFFLYNKKLLESFTWLSFLLFVILILCRIFGGKFYTFNWAKQWHPYCKIQLGEDCLKWCFGAFIILLLFVLFSLITAICFCLYEKEKATILLLTDFLIIYCTYRQCFVWECSQNWPTPEKCCVNKKRFEGALPEFFDMLLIVLLAMFISNNSLNAFDLSFRKPNIHYEITLRKGRNTFEKVVSKMSIDVEEKHFLKRLKEEKNLLSLEEWCKKSKENSGFDFYRITKRFLQTLETKGLINIDEESRVSLSEEGREFLKLNN